MNVKKIKLKKIKIFIAIFFVLCASGFTLYAQAQTTSIHLEAGIITSESELELRVLATPRSPVNAFDIKLQYSREHFEFLRASTAHSVVDFWQSLPPKAREGSIRLTGGMIKPLSGQGELITLVFRVRKPGKTEFVMKKGDFALADGKGTAASVPETRLSITIVQNGTEKFVETPLPAPKITEVKVASDPIEKVAVLSAKTENDGAVEKLEVRSRKWIFWSDWQESRLTATIPQSAWMAQVAAISWDGGRTETFVYRWNVAFLKLFTILALLAVLGYFGRRIIKGNKLRNLINPTKSLQ